MRVSFLVGDFPMALVHYGYEPAAVLLVIIVATHVTLLTAS